VTRTRTQAGAEGHGARDAGSGRRALVNGSSKNDASRSGAKCSWGGRGPACGVWVVRVVQAVSGGGRTRQRSVCKERMEDAVRRIGVYIWIITQAPRLPLPH
jgi:hypothetical protein